MKVCCSTYWYPEHSSDVKATYVHDINRHLVKLGHEVHVVAPTMKGELKDEFDGVKIHRFRLKIPLELEYGMVGPSSASVKGLFDKIGVKIVLLKYILQNFWHTWSISKRYNVNVIHAHWGIPSGFSALFAARLQNIPCVITMHGGDVYYNPEQGYIYPQLWYVRPFLRFTLKHADKLIAISEDCKKHALNASAPTEKTVVVKNGSDLERFNPNINENLKRIALTKHIIFSCRQLIPRKGMRFLIKAMPMILEVFPDTRLLIAGDGIERPYLEDLVKELELNNNVQFLGWIPNAELPPYYLASNLSVIPSLEEGVGIPAVEAMACGKPVVGTDAGGLPEVIENEVTGLIVPRGDSKALADAIIRILSNPELQEEMGVLGRKRAESLFSWQKVAEKISMIYDELIKEGGQ